MRHAVCLWVLCTLACVGSSAKPTPPPPPDFTQIPGTAEAPVGFDGLSNGLVDQATHLHDLAAFNEIEDVAGGLGPLFNASSCRACHDTPTAGGSSQVTELRVGHLDTQGNFVTPEVPLAGGAAVVTGRSLINDRAICPSGAFPAEEIQEHVPDGETIRALRLSISVLGDGFVEAVPDQTLIAVAKWQCQQMGTEVCGTVSAVPVLEAPGTYAAGRFGWKNQQASLLSFSADAYLNEMGVTNRLLPTEPTTLCDTVADPEDRTGQDGLSDLDRFARFIRATKAPARDLRLSTTAAAKNGQVVFESIGCGTCHLHTLVTAPAGTVLHGGAYTVPAALGSRAIHPYSDYLLHDVGTGDGIAVAVLEHHGSRYREMASHYQFGAPLIRTAPLWGLRTRSRLMHDGQSVTLREALLRHGGEAAGAVSRFGALDAGAQEQLLTFLRSL
jgi:CxxC motif-containing protein (DUF1111 family)